jgi:hypothetical protein
MAIEYKKPTEMLEGEMFYPHGADSAIPTYSIQPYAVHSQYILYKIETTPDGEQFIYARSDEELRIEVEEGM